MLYFSVIEIPVTSGSNFYILELILDAIHFQYLLTFIFLYMTSWFFLQTLLPDYHASTQMFMLQYFKRFTKIIFKQREKN